MPCDGFIPLRTGDIARIAGVHISFIRNWLSREVMPSAGREAENGWRRFSKIEALKFLAAIQINRDLGVSANAACWIASTVIQQKTMDLHGYSGGQWIAAARDGDNYCWCTASNFAEAASGPMLAHFPVTTRILIPISEILRKLERYQSEGLSLRQECGEGEE